MVILSLKRSLRSISLHPQKANYLQQRNAYALPHPKTAIAPLHIPKKRTACSSATLTHSHTSPKSDSYGALRYRTPTSPKSELLAAALRYRTPNILKKRSQLHSIFVPIKILHQQSNTISVDMTV
ncbi:MAG: hypothetical protein PT120_20785 [Aphanizomenon gracile PMC649.10]|nr:hypothetical protein [Aphanizomenon gracile PMC649.10]MDM3859601.1 hypothetical protein [Aphanizomenon gracile PMC644.10]